jgi:hypothetical protein
MKDIRYPNITGRTEEQRLRQLESWLRQLVDQLNYALDALEKQIKEGGKST